MTGIRRPTSSRPIALIACEAISIISNTSLSSCTNSTVNAWSAGVAVPDICYDYFA